MPELSTRHVFMSYSRRDDVVMRRIVIFLRSQGIKVWVDNEKLIPGTPIWEEEIEKAVQNTSAVIVVLSPDSKDSEWVRREINLADQHEKRVFPVLVRGDEKTSISLRLIGRQYVDIRTYEEAGLNYVSASILRYLEDLDAQEQNTKKEASRLAAQKTRTEKRLAKQKADEERIAYEKSVGRASNLTNENENRLAAQKAEEERIAREKAETERKAKADAERLAVQKAEDERIAREKAETERKAKIEIDRLAVQKAEAERITREKAEAERKAKAEAEEQKIAEQKAKEQRIAQAKIEARRKAIEKLKRLVNKNWMALINRFQLNLRNKPNIYILFGVAALLVAAMAILITRQFFQTNLFYSGISGVKTDIYSYDGRTETIIVTHDLLGIKNWSPVSRPSGQLYFTSNKDGSAEIYRIKNDGSPEQVTDGQGNDSSWSPAFDLMGQLYFTSNSDGTAEIYRRKNDGKNEQITDGQGNNASWSPAFDLMGQLYFTSNSDGTAEIYRRKNDGKNEQITDTEKGYASWGPVFDSVGRLYFTSDRTGKAEIYIMESDGPKRITNTLFSNWAPVIEGKNIYFTSNRNGHDEVFLLDGTKAIPISSIDKSWTAPLSGRYPFSTP